MHNPMIRVLSGLKFTPLFFCFAILLGWSSSAWAEPVPETAAHSENDVYAKGRLSLQLVSGALFSLTNVPDGTPVFNYAQTNLRLGVMFTDPGPQDCFLRGNWEGIFEVTNSIIFKGFGNYMGGVTALVRYNFVQPDWKVIPYLQAGAGIIYNDAYKDQSQNAIGQAIEFTPQASVGLHYMISDKWALDVEGMIQHISNADMAERNSGINAVGGFVGITYFFDGLWQWQVPSE
ncbi:MAG: acyloxyacyl hydrolase [Deltaproteobacteria bacterium]|nr:acyloxyacyl hydrolase [Deltaproteobacteria bacterium]